MFSANGMRASRGDMAHTIRHKPNDLRRLPETSENGNGYQEGIDAPPEGVSVLFCVEDILKEA